MIYRLITSFLLLVALAAAVYFTGDEPVSTTSRAPSTPIGLTPDDTSMKGLKIE